MREALTLSTASMDGSLSENGSITVFTGPMYACKTSLLIAEIDREQRGAIARSASEAKNHVLVLVPEIERRYDESGRSVTSHDGARCAALPVPLNEPLLQSVKRLYATELAHSRVVAIDEAQWLNGLVEFCEHVASVLGKRVLVAGLVLTSQRTPFGEMHTLIACAERTLHLTAVCVRCGRDAAFTQRNENAPRDTVLVGGEGIYSAVCRHHWSA